jgi:hypothetical protein
MFSSARFIRVGIQNNGWRQCWQSRSLHADLREYVNYSASASKRLARGLFHAMMRFGPKLDREQLPFRVSLGLRPNFLR